MPVMPLNVKTCCWPRPALPPTMQMMRAARLIVIEALLNDAAGTVTSW